MSASHEHLAEVARQAAVSVGDLLRAAFRSRPDVDFKRDRHDPVTVHDKAAEAVIRELILAAVPDSRIIGAVSVSGPSMRFTDERLEKELIPLVIRSGEEISHKLGYHK